MGRPTMGGGGGGPRASSGGHRPGIASGGHSFSRPASTPRPQMNHSHNNSSVPKRSSTAHVHTSPPPPPPMPHMPPPPPRHTHHGPTVYGPVIINNTNSSGSSRQYDSAERRHYSEDGSRNSSSDGTHDSRTKHTTKMEDLKNKRFSTILFMIGVPIFTFLIVFLLAHLMNLSDAGNTREKLTGTIYAENCIEDQLQWFEDENETEKELKSFFDETGVQPYIYLKKYDASLKTDADKEEWAVDWYQNNITNDYTFLYVYFEDQDPNEVGYMSYVAGVDAQSVMDSDAVDTFWSNIDRFWDAEPDTGEMFCKVFETTADDIMPFSENYKFPVFPLFILVAGPIEVYLLVQLLNTNKKIKEKDREDARRIINTPIEDLVDQETEKLREKYK